MNTDIKSILLNLDVLHYGLSGLSVLLFLLVIILFVKKNGVSKQEAEEEAGALPQTPVQEKPPEFKEASADSALQLLALLQQEARLIDFLEEDAQTFSDAEVGAAARVVHDGARKVLRENFKINPIRTEEEGVRLTLEAGFNNQEVRLSGNVVGEAPFTGQLIHRGWRVSDVTLPKVSPEHELNIVAPAELEI
ncbi:MAG: DUF2760 domain-containing protein [Pseudomonadales bacterium]|nr:DUF2760 domain-containing protein [Pseudomonadales bacterium]